MAEQKPTPSWMRPIAVRAGLCILPALWACFEAWTGATSWAILFLAVAVYGVWTLIVKYQPPPPEA